VNPCRCRATRGRNFRVTLTSRGRRHWHCAGEREIKRPLSRVSSLSSWKNARVLVHRIVADRSKSHLGHFCSLDRARIRETRGVRSRAVTAKHRLAIDRSSSAASSAARWSPISFAFTAARRLGSLYLAVIRFYATCFSHPGCGSLKRGPCVSF